MKKIKQYLISMFLIVLLINTTYGFTGMTGNISTAQPDLINSTESDQDIILVQSLIEVDSVQLQSQSELYVRETLIYRNSGTQNFTGSLRTWVPDGTEGIRIGRSEMTENSNPENLTWEQNGNIISWQGEINTTASPPIYTVEYVLPVEPTGTKQYSKMFLYPTLVTKKPNSIVLKITLNKGESAAITDEKENSVSSSGSPREEDNSTLYDWESPQFNEMNIAITSSTAQPDLINSTESDQDIILAMGLIEVDSVQFQSRNELYVKETLIFSNSGTQNFTGPLRTWVPDGTEGIRMGRSEMTESANPENLTWEQNGNIISWQGEINAPPTLPPIYTLEYLLPAEPKGAAQYSKMLLYPTLVTKKPNSIKLRITLNKDESAAITDENGNSISSSGNPSEDGNSILYGWESPQFNEINVVISSSTAASSGIAGYVILGLIIILAVSYLFIRKKSEKIRSFEEKFRNSLKRKETVKETAKETRMKVAAETKKPEPVKRAEDTEFEGKTRDELQIMKDETLSRVSELNKEYESGNMLDEEYEELKKSYQERIDKIKKRIEKPG